MHIDSERIGVAIATFNSVDVIGECLADIGSGGFTIVLFDDGSSDDTVGVARSHAADIHVIHGDGDAWWGGGTKRAIDKCLALDCEYIVLLNPDVFVTSADVRRLVEIAQARPDTIVAPLVVDRDDPRRIAWAGSRFGRIGWLPIFTSRYVSKRGTSAVGVGLEPYAVDEAHGRGVVVSRLILDRVGSLDVETFPHYGGDVDFSMRARKLGVQIVVAPEIRARLDVKCTGMSRGASSSPRERLRRTGDYLLKRKNGEALRVWWHLMMRHVPRYALLPSYLFNVGLNVLRRTVASG